MSRYSELGPVISRTRDRLVLIPLIFHCQGRSLNILPRTHPPGCWKNSNDVKWIFTPTISTHSLSLFLFLPLSLSLSHNQIFSRPIPLCLCISSFLNFSLLSSTLSLSCLSLSSFSPSYLSMPLHRFLFATSLVSDLILSLSPPPFLSISLSIHHIFLILFILTYRFLSFHNFSFF